MTRTLFDPAKASGATPAQAAPESVGQLTVIQAVNLIKTTLETKLPPSLRVLGEVSNFKRNNHWYFSLKDAEAVLHCVAWATAARKFSFAPKDGDQIVVTGYISHFAPQGKTQLYVSDMQPVGAGALDLKFRALCDQLRGLGYFDDARKKPLPVFPRRIAVVTSATGAAVQDVIKTAAQRCKAVGLVIVDVRVQGEGSTEEIARAIRWVDRQRERLRVDAMLVTRGGGSIEDLWAFNERVVADAVFKCSLPLVAAIGHESDTTIIELVADVRASTPTQAAMRLVPSTQQLCEQIDHLTHRLGSMMRRQIERERHMVQRHESDLHRIMRTCIGQCRSHFQRLASRLELLQPTAFLARQKIELAKTQQMLHASMQRQIRRCRERLAANDRHLAAVDPHGVLRRGYSLTTRVDGSLIRSTSQVRAGDQLMTRIADGTIGSLVTAQHSAPLRSSKEKRNSTTSADQLNLFARSEPSK